MGNMAETVDVECVVAAGDVHHFEGVRSTQDPLWMTNYEQVYSHPELMLPWYALLGNHEYRGNTQAVLDYTRVSARWNMPSRYYTKVLENDGVTVRLVLLDTSPLIQKYRKDTAKYPDAVLQDDKRQLAWMDSVLNVAKEDWVAVAVIILFLQKRVKMTANAWICRNGWMPFCVNIKMCLCIFVDISITFSIFECRAVRLTMW